MRLKQLDEWRRDLPQGVIEDRLSQVKKLFDNAVGEHSGEIFSDPLGRYPESYLASFSSPRDAMQAAVNLMKTLSKASHGLPKEGVGAACAINSGEIVERNQQPMGRALDIVSRLEFRAETGQILFTESALLSVKELSLPYRLLLRKIGEETGPEMQAFELDWTGVKDGES